MDYLQSFGPDSPRRHRQNRPLRANTASRSNGIRSEGQDVPQSFLDQYPDFKNRPVVSSTPFKSNSGLPSSNPLMARLMFTSSTTSKSRPRIVEACIDCSIAVPSVSAMSCVSAPLATHELNQQYTHSERQAWALTGKLRLLRPLHGPHHFRCNQPRAQPVRSLARQASPSRAFDSGHSHN